MVKVSRIFNEFTTIKGQRDANMFLVKRWYISHFQSLVLTAYAEPDSQLAKESVQAYIRADNACRARLARTGQPFVPSPVDHWLTIG